MKQNKKYDRYGNEYNGSPAEDRSNPNSFREQEYQRGRSNQYYRDIPEQYGDNRYRSNPEWDINRGYNPGSGYPYGSGSGNWNQYGGNPDQYRNRYNEYPNNPGYRNYQDSGFSSERNYRNMNENDRTWWDKTTDEVSSWFGSEGAKHRRRMDEFNEGTYKGKGPKNYTRSSEKIREVVCEYLSDDSHIDASDIDVTVKGTEVSLTGTVESKQAKRRAEDLADLVSGVSHVQNNLRVNESWHVNSGSNEMSAKNTDTKFSRNATKETSSMHN